MYDAPHAQAEHEADPADLERFYERLPSLDIVADPELVLADALSLLVGLTDSRFVYVEIVGDDSAPTIWRGHVASCGPVDSIRSQISYGIVRRALTEGRTIETSSAFRDERFIELSSVRQNEIGAVICAPLGVRIPVGAVYLQGARAFSTADRRRVESLARRLVRIAPRLIQGKAKIRRPLFDEIRELQDCRIREAVDRHDGNIAEVARELCVGRKFVYGVLARLTEAVSK